jgi:hypothetical protein
MMAPLMGFLVKKSTTFPIEYAKMSLGINRKEIKKKTIGSFKGVFLEIGVLH